MRFKRIALVAALAAILSLVMLYSISQWLAAPRNSTERAADVAAVAAPASPGVKAAANGKLEDSLAQIDAAFRRGDNASLNRFAGEKAVDLQKNQVRVILEMDVSPEPHAIPGPMQTVVLSDGRQVQVQQGSIITIRADLAAAIAATGAAYETASGDAVQVLAPFASLQALTTIPGVRMVRLPYAAK